ncbi:MAG: DUF4079 domain-containing protein [Cyanobacteria bacterium SBLK]|nr:DUF4079 domain-containing protein [Cyanobacteria bacterium SBLK]
MNIELLTSWIHPMFAVVWVFPLIGIVTYFSLQTRQRRLQMKAGTKSKIPPAVGIQHVQIGRWLAVSVVILSLIGFAHPTIAKGFIGKNLLSEAPGRGIFLIFVFVLTLISLIFLSRIKPKFWRAFFATLTSMGLIVIGTQEWIFRRGNEWYWSHYYYGLIASILMVISLAIVPEIYKDRSLAWRRLHIALNSFALLLFIGQGITGIRDVAEIAFLSAK